MTRYLRISGLCFSLVITVSLIGFVAAFADQDLPGGTGKTKTTEAPEITVPSDGQDDWPPPPPDLKQEDVDGPNVIGTETDDSPKAYIPKDDPPHPSTGAGGGAVVPKPGLPK